MHKAILMLLLAVVSNSAVAKWTAVNENKESIQYVDLATIRKSGNKVKMWSLSDYKSVQGVAGNKFLSSKIQWEYECKEEQLRQLFCQPFSGYGGRGQPTTWHNKPGEWKPVMPQSIGEIIWKIACGKTRATAEWTKVDIPSLSDVATQYVDLTTITKAGNSRCRHVLVQAAWQYRTHPRLSIALQQRQLGQPPEVIGHSWKAQHRLHKTYHRIGAKKSSSIAVVAVARELVGFLWAVMHDLEYQLPASLKDAA